MTIIDSISKDYEQYLSHCLDVLTIKTDIIDIDYSKGETDCTRLIFIEKNDLTSFHTLAILTIRLMMYSEEWNDLKNYKKEDFERWIPILKKQYDNCMYFPNIAIEDFENDFFVARLSASKEIKSMKYNDESIDFQRFKQINPLVHEDILSVSKTRFSGLMEEFYVQTSHHFVLFNWFTTA